MGETSEVKDIGFAKLDFARRARTGFGETVFGPGKTPEQIVGIFRAFRARRLPVLATRCTTEQADALAAAGVQVRYDPVARAITSDWGRNKKLKGRVAVLTGGTADIPVAEEAAQSAEFFGATVDRFFDVGVAGLHRLLSQLDAIRKTDVVIAVAGMEGALPSVVAGLVAVPVVAVPTSVGYGVGAGGVAAALAMLNSCAEGVSVVNIDNGFGAAVVACRMLARQGTCYAALASDEIRAESSSGGAFTVLARHILARGGAVCGAAFDADFRCRYEIVRDEASLARLRGSKYVRAALPRSFLAELRTTLESGVPVLFCGTPCHVDAVRRMFATFADSLFTVDLICAGCPDQSLFDRYLDDNWGRANVAKYEFRNKARGWRHHHYLLHVVLKDGREIWRERGEDEFMTAMSTGLGVSAGCFKCPFCTMDRPGDITIGDFWMVPEEMDDGKGTSALLLNTEKGVALFNAVRGDFVKVSEYPSSILEQSQARLRSPRNVPPGRETFWRTLNDVGATVKDAVDRA